MKQNEYLMIVRPDKQITINDVKLLENDLIIRIDKYKYFSPKYQIEFESSMCNFECIDTYKI